jgi:hypothetical protein
MLAVRRSLAGLLIVLGVGTIAYAVLSSETDEEAIARRLAALADAVGVRDGEGLLFRRARLNGVFEAVLTDDVTVHVPDWGVPRRGRDDVLLLATRAGTYLRSGTVELAGLDVTHESGADGASATATAILTSTGGSQALQQQSRGVRFELTREDGDWYIGAIMVASGDRAAPVR